MSKIIKQLAIKRNDPRVRRIYIRRELPWSTNGGSRGGARGSERGRGQAATATTTTKPVEKKFAGNNGKRRPPDDELGEKTSLPRFFFFFPSTRFSIDDCVFNYVVAFTSCDKRNAGFRFASGFSSPLCLFAGMFIICFKLAIRHTFYTPGPFSNVCDACYCCY